MLKVGLTGGIGAGKTTAAKMFAELGCHVIDADSITRDLFKPGHPVRTLVAAAFGPAVVASDGSIDRKVLGELVFRDEGLRQKLNGIVHPAILQRQKAFLDVASGVDPDGIGMVEAALMVEAGTYKNYDKLVVVITSPEIQRQRLRERTNLTGDEIEARIGAQLPMPEKAKFADYIIDNSGTLEDMRRQVETIYYELRGLELAMGGDSDKRD
ncbi:MAG TPA: dephospho-CoA kinase [Terriglobia bacterium]|nr:dephospho-CoA kinase [Terriglobia bacterium]